MKASFGFYLVTAGESTLFLFLFSFVNTRICLQRDQQNSGFLLKNLTSLRRQNKPTDDVGEKREHIITYGVYELDMTYYKCNLHKILKINMHN